MVTWDDLELKTLVAIYDRGANVKREYNEYEGVPAHLHVGRGPSAI